MNSIPRRHECVSIGLEVIFPLKGLKHAPRSKKHSYYIPNQFPICKKVIGYEKGMYNEITRNSTGRIRCSN